MLTVVKKSIDIKAPVDTVFTYFARPEHVSDQMSDKGVGMTSFLWISKQVWV